VVHLASSQRSRGSEVKDGRFDDVGYGAVKVKPNYHSLDVIFLLPYRDILVFVFTLNRITRVDGEASIQSSLFHPLAIVAF
jgi:hypothetical protein